MNERLHDMTQSRDVISQENKKIKKIQQIFNCNLIVRDFECREHGAG